MKVCIGEILVFYWEIILIIDYSLVEEYHWVYLRIVIIIWVSLWFIYCGRILLIIFYLSIVEEYYWLSLIWVVYWERLYYWLIDWERERETRLFIEHRERERERERDRERLKDIYEFG